LVQRVGGDLAQPGLGQRVEVDRLVLDPERVVEAATLGHAHVERHLTALETETDRVAGLLALGAAARGLAALATRATTDALAVPVGTRRGFEIVKLVHGVTLRRRFRKPRAGAGSS